MSFRELVLLLCSIFTPAGGGSVQSLAINVLATREEAVCKQYNNKDSLYYNK